MHLINHFLKLTTGKSQIEDFTVHLNNILPKDKGEFTDNTKVKIVREIQKCGFTGELHGVWFNRRYEHVNNANIVMDFTASNNNTRLLKRYLDHFYYNQCFKMDNESTQKYIKRYIETDQVIIDQLIKNTQGGLVSKFTNNCTAEIDVYHFGDIISKLSVEDKGRSLTSRVWLHYNKEKYKTLTYNNKRWNTDQVYFASHSFTPQVVYKQLFIALVVSNCCKDSRMDIDLDFDQKYMNITNRNKESCLMKINQVLKLYNEAKQFVMDLNIDKIFSQENIDKSIEETVEMLKRFKVDVAETYNENARISDFTHDDDVVNEKIKLVEKAMEQKGITDEVINKLRTKIDLSIKMQQMVA